MLTDPLGSPTHRGASALPGSPESPEEGARLSGGGYETLDAISPNGRMGEIADIVDAVLYLEGASSVTGETLHVDGGSIAGH